MCSALCRSDTLRCGFQTSAAQGPAQSTLTHSAYSLGAGREVVELGLITDAWITVHHVTLMACERTTDSADHPPYNVHRDHAISDKPSTFPSVVFAEPRLPDEAIRNVWRGMPGRSTIAMAPASAARRAAKRSWNALTVELADWILAYLASMGFTSPTPTQIAVLELFRTNKDVVVEAMCVRCRLLA